MKERGVISRIGGGKFVASSWAGISTDLARKAVLD